VILNLLLFGCFMSSYCTRVSELELGNTTTIPFAKSGIKIYSFAATNELGALWYEL
jgi:hypothetical protein